MMTDEVASERRQSLLQDTNLYVDHTSTDIVFRSPGVYSSSILPEKIVNCCVTENGVRFYKIQWQDSWLPEELIVQFSNHQNLIESFWLRENTLSQPISTIFYKKPLKKTKYPSKSKKVPSNIDLLATTSILPQQEETNLVSAHLKTSQVHDIESESLATAVDTLANNLSLNSNNSHLLYPVHDTVTTTDNNVIRQQSGREDMYVQSNHNSAESASSILENNVLKAQLSAILDETVSAISQNETSQINEAMSVGEIAVEVEIPMPFQQVNSKINALSKFSTGLNSKKQKHVISMDTFELVNIENSENTEEELKTAAIEVLSSFKRKRVRFPNGTSKLPQKCFFCLRSISNRKKLREHQFSTHFRNIGEHACPICGLRFVFHRQLRDHLVSHTDMRKFVCKICGLTCKRRSHLHKHMDTHKKERNFRCDVCHENFKVQADLKEHCFKVHVNKSMQCNVCKNTLNTPNSVYLHSLRHSGTRDFSCEICHRSFKRKQHLITHSHTHDKEKEKFKCPGCDKIFTDKKFFRKHLDLMHKEIANDLKYNYSCSICKKSFAYKGRLDEHMKTHENETENERIARSSKKRVDALSDEEIAKEFQDFEKIINTEAHEVRLKCKKCKDRDFRMISAAKRHMSEHLSGRVQKVSNYTCSLCKKCFSSQLKLKAHTDLCNPNGSKISHGKTVYFQCHKCGRSFKWKSLLQFHVSKCDFSTSSAQANLSKRNSPIKITVATSQHSTSETSPVVFVVASPEINDNPSRSLSPDKNQVDSQYVIAKNDIEHSNNLTSSVEVSLDDNIFIAVEDTLASDTPDDSDERKINSDESSEHSLNISAFNDLNEDLTISFSQENQVSKSVNNGDNHGIFENPRSENVIEMATPRCNQDLVLQDLKLPM